ncbi:MAG TPA: GNVR domain-containing protein, partial [Nitrososphaera sp.]|nr:GNVR domain-containing protein [Nitrososphaera sp.]
DLQKELALQEVQLNSLQVKKQTLEQHIASYQQDLERLNSYDLEVKRLQRQINVEEENYLLTRKKLEEARISEVLDAERIVSVSVVEPAAASFLPVKPKRKVLIVGLGLVLGVVSGIGFAFLAEYFDHSIKTPKDVDRYLGLPLLASIQEAKR